jgi:hypothetical protein
MAGETLYRLGVNYNKVPLSSLKTWNNLASDALTVGTPMIVGFLKVDKNQSALATKQSPANVAVATVPQETITPEVKVEKNDNPVVAASPTVQTAEPKSQPTTANNATTPVISTTTSPADNNTSGGYFKNLYEQQIAGKSTIDKNGSAGVFKSTSGWQDGKYYCFSNDAEAGTILKITNATTAKSVYAKVLDVIPDISQNDGLIIVISNSAADELGAGNNSFSCNVSFAKK